VPGLSLGNENNVSCTIERTPRERPLTAASCHSHSHESVALMVSFCSAIILDSQAFYAVDAIIELNTLRVAQRSPA